MITPVRTAGMSTSETVGNLSQAQQPDPGDLACEQVAGGHASEEHLDGAARLLFNDAAQDHGSVGRDGAEEYERHDERCGLVVRAASPHDAELDVLYRCGREHRRKIFRADAGRRRPLADRDELDGAGDDRLELVVGALSPLELPAVDHEDIDLAVPDCVFAGCN
jgi:hypothetical protein